MYRQFSTNTIEQEDTRFEGLNLYRNTVEMEPVENKSKSNLYRH